jgi:hypothetical protein
LKIEDWVESEEERAAIQEWLAGLPPDVRELAIRCPAYVPCYGMKENNGHYQIISYGESLVGLRPTMAVAHGRDSYLPGVAVFGVPGEDMIPCGCGKWELPTTDQINIARASVGEPQIPEVKSETIH